MSGGVEKMYIHFYTVLDTDSTLRLMWYATATENVELFQDFKHYMSMMKMYGYYKSYTGDIFEVRGLQRFREFIILLGTDVCEGSPKTWSLSDGSSIEVESYTMKNPAIFNDLYDVCFYDYISIQTFSSDEGAAAAAAATKDTSPVSALILVQFNGAHALLPHYRFKKFPYERIKSKIEDHMLFNWFNVLIAKSNHFEASSTIQRLIDFNIAAAAATTTVEADDDNDTIVTDAGSTITTSANICNNEWISLFCDLYMEEDKNSDILLSDVYNAYLTASSWISSETVSRLSFVKKLRASNQFIIKRRSKGMVILGYKCLVLEQEAIQQKMRTGVNTGRYIFSFIDPSSMCNIIEKNKGLIYELTNSGCKYAREIVILLKDIENFNITHQSVAQFTSIPNMAKNLQIYSEYIDRIQTDYINNSGSKEDFDKYINKPHEEYWKLTQKCKLYFPFNIKYYKLNLLSQYFGPSTINTCDDIEPYNSQVDRFLSRKRGYDFQANSSFEWVTASNTVADGTAFSIGKINSGSYADDISGLISKPSRPNTNTTTTKNVPYEIHTCTKKPEAAAAAAIQEGTRKYPLLDLRDDPMTNPKIFEPL